MSAPMPRAAPVTTATLPASGRSGARCSPARALPDPEHLGVDVGRAGREQELDGAQRRGLGAVGDEHEVGGGAGAQLLGDRAGDALEGAPGGTLGRRPSPGPGRGRRRRPGRSGRAASAPGPRVARRDSRSAGVLGGGEVDDDPAEPACLGDRLDERGPGGVEAVAQRGEGRGVPWPPTSTGPSTSGRPGTCRRRATGCGSPRVVASSCPRPEDDEGRVAVAVRHVRPPRGSRRRPGHRPRRSRSRPREPGPLLVEQRGEGGDDATARWRRTGGPRPARSRRR